MALVKLFNFLIGYVTISIKGAFPERFLNICARRRIYLWNVKRQGVARINANISVKGFKLIRPIAKKSRCNIYINQRHGIPFFLYKHRKRKIFAAGAVFFIISLFIITRFIWVIDITGNNEVETVQIIEVLSEAGLKTGVLSSKVVISDIQNYTMTKLGKIAWIGINLKGTTAFVEIKERLSTPDLFQKDLPCNIVAKTDGVIESIDAVNGNRLVSIGDVVGKGQLLISGVIDSKAGDGVRYLHADGEVLATTWHEITVEVPKYEQIRTRTGKSKSKHMVKFFNFYVNFFLNDRISYSNYDRISYVKKFAIGNNIVFPLSFHYDNYYEVEITQQPYELTEALTLAENEAYKQVAGLTIKSKRKKADNNKLTVIYECLENIAEKATILKEERTEEHEHNKSDEG
ncbi:MAG: sporulation protein YqfD [Clostridiaceae bacterium]|jgi:similar to stage IV sporulation protein|nr:sporulation protein YqfD [Clostridiaceae bacterium]